MIYKYKQPISERLLIQSNKINEIAEMKYLNILFRRILQYGSSELSVTSGLHSESTYH